MATTSKDFKVGAIRPIPAELLSRPTHRESKYRQVLESMAKLRNEGEGFEISPPEGVPIKVFANRITSLLMGHPVDPPRGLRFSKHLTKNGTVAVLLTRIKQ